MPVLPLIDALIFLGWSSLMIAFVLKGIDISTSFRPHVFGLTAFDFLLGAGVCMLFALTLAARTWVKANEARLFERGRLAAAPRPEAADEGRASDRSDGSEELGSRSSGGRQVAAGR
jgi:hypothetical protein